MKTSASPSLKYWFTLVLSISFTCITNGDDGWESAKATSTMNAQGMAHCGYSLKEGYNYNVSISVAMYLTGRTCGACYEIKCNNHTTCITNSSIRVVATAQCTASYSNGSRRWCETPNNHFELSTDFFQLISQDLGAVIPVVYRRVPCIKKGGIKFDMLGEDDFFGVFVYNVAGPGDVWKVKVKGTSSDWLELENLSADQKWYAYNTRLVNQSLSFQVIASDGRLVQSDNIVPKEWKFGQSYEGGQF